MFMKLFRGIATLLAAAFCLPAFAASPIEIIVPAYFYPSFAGSDWDRLTAAAAQSGVRVTAIMNPNSGPGTAANSDYIAAIGAFRAAGGKVLGYVPSGYIGQQVNAGASCQPASGSVYTTSDVVGCGATYASFYTIDGIFVDEMGPPIGGAPEPQVLAFYQTVYDGLKGVNAAWTIFGNPGQAAPEGLLRDGALGGADTIVTFENFAALYDNTLPSAYTTNYAASRFANILIESAPGFDVQAAVNLAGSRNVGYFYATDDRLPNPYDVLPSYWNAQVAAVRQYNASLGAVPEPGTWMMMLVGFGFVGRATRVRRRIVAA
jgi:Spherulation-specific family 4/PEP-CTERM motif